VKDGCAAGWVGEEKVGNGCTAAWVGERSGLLGVLLAGRSVLLDIKQAISQVPEALGRSGVLR
jgi:hypothetical protein